jgi:hypothetical protein
MRLENSVEESLIWQADIFRGRADDLPEGFNALEYFKGMDWVHLRLLANQEDTFLRLNEMGIIWGVKNFLHQMEWKFSPSEFLNEFSDIEFVPAHSIAHSELHELTFSLVESTSSKNFQHPIAEFFYAMYPENHAYSDFYIKAATSSDYISEVLLYDKKTSGLLILKKESDWLSGVFYGVSHSVRGSKSLGRFIMGRIKQLVREHNCNGFRSYVPVHNIPSLRAHIHEQIFPVSSCVNLMLFPLMGRVLKAGSYFQSKTVDLNSGILHKIEVFESLNSSIIVECNPGNFPKLLSR